MSYAHYPKGNPMLSNAQTKPIDILLVEDNQGDVRLTTEAFQQSNLWIKIHVVPDGIEALEFLKKSGDHTSASRPDLILLDLNLPRKDGRQVLKEIKTDPELSAIPIIVLTTSQTKEDIDQVYDWMANCFICKPTDFNQYSQVVKTIEDFWLNIVRLPMTSV
jgi:CheY-like chemotaxis protein